MRVAISSMAKLGIKRIYFSLPNQLPRQISHRLTLRITWMMSRVGGRVSFAPEKAELERL